MRNAHFFCYPTCHYVDFVLVGTCDEEGNVFAALFHACPFKHAGPCSVPPYNDHVKVVFYTLRPLFILFDHDYVVAVRREVFCYVISNFSRSDQNDLQPYSAFRC